MTEEVANLVIAVLGGTGDQGRGLAHRFAAAGNPVIIGSRSAERAMAAAESLRADREIRGMTNADAAREADVVIVALQWMITGRVTIHAARIGDDFGSFQKKRLRPCGAIGHA